MNEIIDDTPKSEQRCELCKRTGCYFHPGVAKPRGLDVDTPITIPVFIERFGCGKFVNEDRQVSAFPSLMALISDRFCGTRPQRFSNEKPISRKKLETFFRSARQGTEDIADNHRLLYVTGRNILADAGLMALILGEFDEDPNQTKLPSEVRIGSIMYDKILSAQVREDFSQKLAQVIYNLQKERKDGTIPTAWIIHEIETLRKGES